MTTVDVLDHGFVRLVDTMGDDSSITQAARVSYGLGTKTARDDEGLIRYLMRHGHTTPFEMCEIKLHVKLPIFVARQWVRHRTANINEYSARYSVLPDEFYVPSLDQLTPQSMTNRQGRSPAELSQMDEWAQSLRNLRNAVAQHSDGSYALYNDLLGLSDEAVEAGFPGVSRELARIILPANVYTQWYWKIDLHNLFHFLKARMDEHAQYEIRAYATVIADMVKAWVPIAYRAFEDYQVNAVNLSGPAIAVVRRLIVGEQVSLEDSGLGAREWTELMHEIGKPSSQPGSAPLTAESVSAGIG